MRRLPKGPDNEPVFLARVEVIIAILALIIAIPGGILAIRDLQPDPTPTSIQTEAPAPDESPEPTGEVPSPKPDTSCATTIRSDNPGVNSIRELYSGPSGTSTHFTRLLTISEPVIAMQSATNTASGKIWYQIQTPDGDYLGWISEDFIAPLSSDCPL